MTVQTPIVDASFKYVNGLSISNAGGNKIVTMASGSARDSTNTNDIILNSSLTINGATVGVNGVDLSAVISNSVYYVYVIGDSTKYKATAALLSLNATTPVLPQGYDMFRRVGCVRTFVDGTIIKFYQYGQGLDRVYYYDLLISVLASGTATTFTAIDLSSVVPASTAVEVIASYTYVAALAQNVVQFLPFGSASPVGIIRIGAGSSSSSVGMVTIPCGLDSGVPKILYKVITSDNVSLNVVGFKDNLS